MWSTSSSLCSCSDKLLRFWSVYSGGATDSVLRRLGVPVWACGCALTVIDVPVVRRRQVSTAFRVPLRVWKRSLLRAASRCSHLDPGHYSYVLLVTGWHSALVFSRQYMVTSGRISGIFYVVSAHEQAGLPHNARLNSGYMFLFCFWRLLDVFQTFSACWCTRILRSILALLSVVFSLQSVKGGTDSRHRSSNMDSQVVLSIHVHLFFE